MNLLRYFNIMVILNIFYISNVFSSDIFEEEKETQDSLKISQKFSPELEKQINVLREKSDILISLKEKLTPETQKEEEIIMKKQLKVLIEEVLVSQKINNEKTVKNLKDELKKDRIPASKVLEMLKTVENLVENEQK